MHLQHELILASKSPRRQQLLNDLGFNFTVKTKEVDESFPENLIAEQIPLYLCKHKANSFSDEIEKENTLVITADTIVWIDNQVLNKPESFEDAKRMLHLLSGKMHEVFTGVCLKSKHKSNHFFVVTKVYFNSRSGDEIETYITTCSPLDKAGSYGAQESLPAGMNPCSTEEIAFLKNMNKLELIEKSIQKNSTEKGIALINKIEGSYFNVMGLPLIELYDALIKFDC